MNNKDLLIKKLTKLNLFEEKKYLAAFNAIDRADFVLDEYKDKAYLDIALPIYHAQTISQPFTVFFMLNLLDPQKNDKVLDIGCGSGYTSALLSHLVSAKSKVIALDIISDLIEFAKNNVKKYKELNIEFRLASEDQIGIKDQKFDKILVSAAVKRLPNELLEQLNLNGKLVIPINDSICIYTKDRKNNLKEEKYYGFSFVPLIY